MVLGEILGGWLFGSKAGFIPEELNLRIPFLSDLTDISDSFAGLSEALIGLVVPQESVAKSVMYWSRVPILTYGLLAIVGAGAGYAFVNSPELQQRVFQLIAKRGVISKKRKKETIVFE